MTDPTRPELDGDDGDVTRRTARDTYDGLGSWFDDAAALLEEWGMAQAIMPRVRFACGVHPHNAKYFDDARDELIALLARPETCCLGEVGLDYHYDFSPRDVQREVFAAQLQMAQEHGLPVSLHLREAHDDALAILRETGVPKAGCIVHCFNLDAQTLAPFLELGCYVAFGGPLTFKKSWETRGGRSRCPRRSPADRNRCSLHGSRALARHGLYAESDRLHLARAARLLWICGGRARLRAFAAASKRHRQGCRGAGDVHARLCGPATGAHRGAVRRATSSRTLSICST